MPDRKEVEFRKLIVSYMNPFLSNLLENKIARDHANYQSSKLVDTFNQLDRQKQDLDDAFSALVDVIDMSDIDIKTTDSEDVVLQKLGLVDRHFPEEQKPLISTFISDLKIALSKPKEK